MSEAKVHDNVNSPAHYAGNTSLECIDVMCVMFGRRAVCIFCLCNAFKYMWRYKHKNGEEDLEKAKWYLNWAYNKYISVRKADAQLQEDYDGLLELYNSIALGDK